MNLRPAIFAFLGFTLPLAAAPAEYFNVVDYGAVPDGRIKDTAAIAKAVAACSAAGGGTVFFPAGRYLTGSISLESNITLSLDAGSELLYSGDPADSPIVQSRWESTNAYTHAPLIYANGKENIAVTGRGTINGQGSNWWWRTGTYDKARAAAMKPAIDSWLKLYDRIEAGEKPGPAEFQLAAEYLRPTLVEFYNCKNVLVEGVTITESPMWLLHPVYCENVSIRGVSFVSTGPNGDGIDIDSSRDVRISDCFFSTGDDCIVIKSGRNADGRRTARPTEHVAITNCVMYKGHGAVVIGSETSAGIRDVVASNIIARGTWFGVRIKSMLGRGGVIENMRFDNFVIEEPTMEAIEITAYYHDKTEDRDSKNATAQQISDRTPIFRNLAFSNMTIANANQVASIEGLAQMAIQRLRFTDVIATGAKGFVCEHAEDIEMRGVRIDAKSGKPLVLNDVHGLRIDGVPQPSVP
jgi:polygalacturonase